jgi:hypothetical protein
MISVKQYFIFIVSMIACQLSLAGGIDGAKITGVITGESDIVFVVFDRDISNLPSCATENRRMSIKPSTPGGKAALASALAAMATKQTVSARGRGSFSANFSATQMCEFWGGVEVLNYLWVLAD